MHISASASVCVWRASGKSRPACDKSTGRASAEGKCSDEDCPAMTRAAYLAWRAEDRSLPIGHRPELEVVLSIALTPPLYRCAPLHDVLCNAE